VRIVFNDNSFIVGATDEIDALCDIARLRIVVDPVRMKEYETAESQATTFKTAGYTGDVPQYVKSWQEAKGWTAQQACDDILAASARWQYALAMLRDSRLKTKEAIKRCTTKVQVDAIVATFKSNLATMMQGVA
jgi:hypothetical protein